MSTRSTIAYASQKTGVVVGNGEERVLIMHLYDEMLDDPPVPFLDIELTWSSYSLTLAIPQEMVKPLAALLERAGEHPEEKG